MTNISVTTYPRILKPKLFVFSHQGESKSIVKSPENSIFQALAIGFHWFFKLFFYNGFLWKIFFSESDISRTKNLRHMKFGMMKYHIMTFKNKVVAPSPGTGAILKKPRIFISLPSNTYGRIAPRSGLALSQCIDISGSYKIL